MLYPLGEKGHGGLVGSQHSSLCSYHSCSSGEEEGTVHLALEKDLLLEDKHLGDSGH